ncbi:hypothetical protein J2X57_000087 [Luteibacter sp. 1214]|uniref:PIN domain-containing protein n=1 Tax=Luteibacter sp. 1214 TaxID=2817735 RepID=UPI0028549785|nr:PIN domain-containing protein [Luteibacter sp. 1214]MDR6640893.1 hypothetical protein [Luteibacter sp. 1214]
MKLRLLIDTCVWLDLVKDHRQLPLIEAIEALIEEGDVELILPTIVVDEFARNKERVVAESKRSLSTHFRLVRDAVAQFAPAEVRDATIGQLNEVDHRISTGGEAANEAVGLVERLFARASQTELTDKVKARAADRALKKIAPFHRQRNGIDDAILIETYADALIERQSEDDVYGFVTHNIHDFSEKGGDSRLPHADLASFFDGTSSRYVTNLAPLLGEFAEELVEDIRFSRELFQEPRRLSELLEAEDKLTQQIWYGRKGNLLDSFESGKLRRVPKEVWERASVEEQRGLIVDSIWDGMIAAMKSTEEDFPGELGPWTDFEWGMLSGKLSAIRWMLGDQWDMLDT